MSTRNALLAFPQCPRRASTFRLPSHNALRQRQRLVSLKMNWKPTPRSARSAAVYAPSGLALLPAFTTLHQALLPASSTIGLGSATSPASIKAIYSIYGVITKLVKKVINSSMQSICQHKLTESLSPMCVEHVGAVSLSLNSVLVMPDPFVMCVIAVLSGLPSKHTQVLTGTRRVVEKSDAHQPQ